MEAFSVCVARGHGQPAGLLRGSGGLRFGVFAAEALDAARSVDQLLLAGEIGVAAGADFNMDVTLMRGARGEAAATGALHTDFVVIRMDILFWHG